jgi:hypothetical protein
LFQRVKDLHLKNAIYALHLDDSTLEDAMEFDDEDIVLM